MLGVCVTVYAWDAHVGLRETEILHAVRDLPTGSKELSTTTKCS